MKRLIDLSLIVLFLSINTFASTDKIAVSTRGSNTASIISVETMEIIATFDTGNGPHELCASPDGRFIYAANYAFMEFIEGEARPKVTPDSTITVFDINLNKVVRTINLGRHFMTHSIAASKDGKKLWLSSERNDAVIEVEIETGNITKEWTAGKGCHMLVASPDNSKLYSANVVSGSITVIDLLSDKVKEVKTGPFSEGLAISPDGKEVWTGNRGDHTVSVYNTELDSLTHNFDSKGTTPFRLFFTPDGKECWVLTTESSDINIFDAETKDWLRKMDFEEMPFALTFNPEGTRAYVTHTDTNGLSEVDVGALKVLRRIELAKEPDGITWVN